MRPDTFKSWRQRIWRLCCLVLLVVSFFVTYPVASWAASTDVVSSSDRVCAQMEQKIDLNNANIVAFQDCPGFYPTLATLIIENSPYAKVDDVLGIKELTPTQKSLLQANLEKFELSSPQVSIGMRMPPRPSMRSNP